MKSTIKAVVFDLDGTLVDSEYGYYLGWKYAFKKKNIHISDEEIKSWSGLSAKDTSALINQVTHDPSLIPELRQDRQTHFFELLKEGKIEMKPYVREMLEFLTEKSIPLALATSTYSDRAQPMLDYFEIDQFFEFKLFGDSVKHLKPSPDVYLKAIENFGFDPIEMLTFEDSLTGVKSAQAAGIPVIVIPDTSLSENHLKLEDYGNVGGVFKSFQEVYEKYFMEGKTK